MKAYILNVSNEKYEKAIQPFKVYASNIKEACEIFLFILKKEEKLKEIRNGIKVNKTNIIKEMIITL
jgi:hypothetical protein